jgi:hypothetical protein
MNANQIAARMTFNPCVRCGEDVHPEAWAQVRAGVLFAICQDCGCRQLAWLFDRETGKPMFNEDGEAVTDRDLPNHRGDDEPAANSPEDIGGPDSGWQNTPAEEAKHKGQVERAEKARANLRLIEGKAMPAPRPPDEAVNEARAEKKAAKTTREIAAADRKLRKARKAEAEKKQGGFTGLWGKDRK